MLRRLSCLCLALVLSASVVAAQTADGPATWAPQLSPVADLPVLPLPPLDGPALAEEDALRETQGLPFRFAVPHDLYLTPDTYGRWESLPDGRAVWRLLIQAPGAVHLNLGFGRFALPAGAALHVTSPDGRTGIRPFTAADMDAHGELWTPVVMGDTALVSLVLRPEVEGDFELALTRVGQGYRGYGAKSASYASGSCNVDVVCPEGDDWQLEIASVGVLQINGFLNCSGVMMNDTANSLTPYYLTAAHCGVSAGSAASVVVYWNYENSFCRVPGSAASGGPGDGQLNQFSSGSTWLAGYSPSDFTLVELDDDPDPAWDVAYAGWDRSGADPNAAIAIHHPSTDEKRISFEDDPVSTTSYLGDAVPGDGTHVKVTDWDLGTTEGGSSGSPLFDPDHRVIGQLHGGFASCSSQTADWYGRLSVSWTGGGTASSRLSDWLDPGNTGAITADTISLNTLCSSAGEVSFLAGSYGCDGTLEVEVIDCDLDLDPDSVEVTTLDIDGYAVLCVETGVSTGRFRGQTPLNPPGGGSLGVFGDDGDTLTVSYTDADDGLGGTNVLVTATALVDCTPAVLSGIAAVDVAATTAGVSYSADEPVQVTVRWGTSCGNLTGSASSDGLASAGTVELTGLDDDTSYRFVVDAVDEAGNLVTADNGGTCFGFTTLPARDYFTEEFISDNDLDGLTLQLTPDGSADGYGVCVSPIGALPSDPAGGNVLVLSDDDSEFVPVVPTQTVSLYGVAYNGFHVGSNGYVTFGSGDSDYDESLGEHFALPRVAPLYDDLNPSSAGTVSWRRFGDHVAVTWQDVPEYNTSNQNTFQVQLFYDGRITMSWLDIAAVDGIVGLSDGQGLGADFFERDLSGYGDCGVVCQLDLGFGGPGDGQLAICGDALASGGSADLTLTGGVPGATALLFVGLVFGPTPIKGGVLVPLPEVLQLTLPLDGSGAGELLGLPGGGGPLTVYVQAAWPDGAQLQGAAFSNALQVEFLP